MSKKKNKKPQGRVVEFTITYFDTTDLETGALLDLYADHAYKFAERHGMTTPLIASRGYPSFEEWEQKA